MPIVKFDTVGSDLVEDPIDFLARTGDPREPVYPEDNELFIDIDSDDDLSVMYALLDTLSNNGVVATVERVTPSRTTGHYHAVLGLDRNVDETERVAFQACLGSDRKRELLSLLRIVLKMNRPPTVFFEDKTEDVPVHVDDDIPF